MTTTILLIIHGLLAVALLGAITHQALSVWWKARKPADSFVGRVRSVPSTSYAGAVVLLYLLTTLLGGIIYPDYRLNVRVVLEQLEMPAANGSFELKEHFAVLGLAMLPAYYYFWRTPLAENYARARAALTLIIAFIVWWNFLVGHILNNIRGFGS
ncbi:MAG TPA: hypothetical protein VH105_10970 [Burkholderiales bacterium]|jgi:hypothetical protein|nr:hypothetical protein [Burkholderiales bacterium]